MTRLVIVAGLSVLSSPSLAYDDAQEIRLSVTGAEPATGQILVSLFNSAESFLAAPVIETTVKVDRNGNATISLGRHTKGEYAIAIIYDKNNNGKLDTGVFRIPKEKTGFSNNASSKFGPAKWEKAKFSLTGSNASIEVHLK